MRYKKRLQTFITIMGKSFVYLFQVVGHFEFAFLRGNVGFHLGVSVVDDGQEHVEQNEEDKEDVQDEERRAKDAVCLLQSLEVEVAKDDTEQCETTGNT